MTDRVPIMPVYLAYGGRVARWSAYGWTACYCVEHDDRTASAQINEESQRFRCLACSTNYDAIALVQAVEKLRFRDAKRRAEELAGADSGVVRAEPRRPGSLLPPRSGHRPPSRRYIPPWASGRAGGRA